jgi:predicted dehydrogenase
MTTQHDGPPNDESPFRALIVGLGSIGQRHARNLRALLGNAVQLLAYRVRRTAPLLSDNLTADETRRPEDVYGIESFDSLERALERRPHAAWICNPTSQHLDVAMLCASSGCDLFLEKPVSDSSRGIDRLLQVVTERGLVVAVSSQLRFHPGLKSLKAVLDSGQLGRPVAVRAQVGEFLPGFHPYEDYRTSYAARRSLGGGVVLTLIHDIDYLIWLFGMPHRLFSVGGKVSSLEVDVEDLASTLMDCGQGMVPFPVHLHMDYIRRPPRRTCEVLCETGVANLDLRANRLEIATPAGEVSSARANEPVERNTLFIAQMTDFLAACRSRVNPAVTLADGAAAVRVAEAVHRSFETRASVMIA